MQLRQQSCHWCFRAKRTQRHYRLYRVALQRENHQGGESAAQNGHKKGHKNVPFWVLAGFAKISASALERMAGTTGLEPAASAVTADFWTISQGVYAVGQWALAPSGLFIQAYAQYGFRYNFMGKEGISRMDPTETRIADQSLVTG
jgi:hypothetical protein